MSFLSHKITAFDTPVSSLPDEPNLSAEELKRCFDSAPEQLRQAVNGLCDEAERLDTRVEGIVAQTYEDTIRESMLDTPLQTKLNAKAEQSDLVAETEAREIMAQALTQKCQMVFGSYVGTDTFGENNPTVINLGFRPKFVVVQPLNYGYHTALGLLPEDGKTTLCPILCASPSATNGVTMRSTATGFEMQSGRNSQEQQNCLDQTYLYVAFR